jgi:outer membrane protein assembly factor BamB
MSSIVIPTPFTRFGLLYLASGFLGDQVRPVFAVKPGASGDISLKPDETSNDCIAWYQRQAGPFNPSPIVYSDHYYTLLDRGFLTCHDARTGKLVYDKQRLDPESAAFTSSPWAKMATRLLCKPGRSTRFWAKTAWAVWPWPRRQFRRAA